MRPQVIYLLWYEEQYEAPQLCGVYNNLAAAQQHRMKLQARRDGYFRFRSKWDYVIDQAKVGTDCKRGVDLWPLKRLSFKETEAKP